MEKASQTMRMEGKYIHQVFGLNRTKQILYIDLEPHSNIDSSLSIMVQRLGQN